MSSTGEPPVQSTTVVVAATPQQTSTEAPPAITSAPATTERPHTGSATACVIGQALADGDGDGWGECVLGLPALHAPTVVWWHSTEAPPADACAAGFDAANAEASVPEGLDRATYDFLCASALAAPAIAPAPSDAAGVTNAPAP
jgi:hypothetical protein